MTEQKQILNFLHEAEKLKSVLRHSWLSGGRRESTAEHTWRMALMALVLHPYLKKKPDLFKTLKMVLVHDLVEVYAGDVPAWKKDKSDKHELELFAIKKLAKTLPKKQGMEISALWQEYQRYKSPEACFAKALDRMEALIQHEEADLKYLRKDEYKFNLLHGLAECSYDPYLKKFRQFLNEEYLKIYKKNKINKKLYA
jgi:putative hydrolase of HD superfamily